MLRVNRILCNILATALEFATAPSGKVLQVLSTTKTDTFSASSTSFTDITGMSVSITPSSASNKILIIADIKMGQEGSQTARLLRNSTVISAGAAAGDRPLGFGSWVDENQYKVDAAVVNFLDSPNTTSSITYKIQVISSGSTYYVNRSLTDRNTAQYDPRTASTITVMEIAG